ncbi:MAG: hypothetical protein J3R72DRAFT_422590 [Linnemannia gamsii]|nr:MAG: hypothetical protein J3R72DRAFT_422590 [Linnemannia gamsii]
MQRYRHVQTYKIQTDQLLIVKCYKDSMFSTLAVHQRYSTPGPRACHKINPSGGLGAISAKHDSIALANLLYALPSTTTHDITVALSEYQTEHLPPAIDAYNGSLILSKLLKGGLTGALALFMANHVPDWLWKHTTGWVLKAAEDRGTLAAKVS